MEMEKLSKRYLNAVIENNDLMSNGVCTQAMNGVFNFLGAGAPDVVPGFNSARDGIYTVTLNFGADINTQGHDTAGWEHGIALQKIGADLLLYQAWVGKFTLGDWLLLNNAVADMASAKYSPMHGQCNRAEMKTWMLKLTGLTSTTVGGDYGSFEQATEALFGPKPGGVSLVQVRRAATNKTALRMHWKHKPLKPIAELS